MKTSTILFLIALVTSTFIKVLAVYGNNFAFTMDQGRDLVDIRQMVVTHIPRLIGPTTSINGVFLGPFYYYFISVPFIFSGGNPAAIVYWQIFWFQLASVILWWVLRKKNYLLADITGTLLLLSPVGFYTGRFFWNANAMPIFTIIFFATLIWALSPDTSLRGAERRGNLYRLFVLGLISGISLQIEAALGILFFPFAVMYLLFTSLRGAERRGNLTPSRTLLPLSIGFLITLIPQILFEFRHGFLMTKTLLAGLSGSSSILGEKLSFAAKIIQRKSVFLGILRDTNHIAFETLSIILLVAFFVGVYYLLSNKSKAVKEPFWVSLAFMFFAGVFYFIFPQQVKSWYISGLSIPVIIYLSAVLANIFKENLLAKLAVWAFILLSFYHVYLAHSEYLYKYALKPSDDPSSQMNELKAVDWVYAQAEGKAFSVYSYLPSVYDFPYQYVFWWHGTKKYGYQPADIAYLPNQPEYIKNSASYWTKKKSVDNTSPTFLIIEKDADHVDRTNAWRGNFSKLCEVKSTQIVDRLAIIMLSSCSK